ncbi:MAG: hypothetical protein H7A25_22970 [Leptospiraceae bacterium]|nr:hypothetical protein [Leptospiraceae bacterium]
MKSLLFFTLLLVFACGPDEKVLFKTYQQAVGLYSNKQLDESLKLFTQVKNEKEGFLHTNIYIGKIHYYKLNFQKAKELFQEDYYRNENRTALYWIIKTDFIVSKNYEEQLKRIDDYLFFDANNYDILYIRGMICKKLNKTDEAILSFSKAISYKEKLANSYIELSKIYRAAGLTEKSVKLEDLAKKLMESDF